MKITKENIKENEIYFAVCCGRISRIKVVKLGHTHTFKDLNETLPLYDYISLDYDPEYIFKNHFISDATRGVLNQLFLTEEEALELITTSYYQSKLAEHIADCRRNYI